MTAQTGRTVGETVVTWLERLGVDVVFGIPGVHTVELYRGLGPSSIRHVTPRHEQGAGFMADGYARATGRVGVAFVITGPGLTNVLTPMAQARADSVPMLVVSAVNRVDSIGRGLGHLHELPDQHGLVASVAVHAEEVRSADDLGDALTAIERRLRHGRPGPMHLAIATDVLAQPAPALPAMPATAGPTLDLNAIADAAGRLAAAERPVLLTGGGAVDAHDAVRSLAESLDAPVVQTVNARGQLHGHPLRVPASPSLASVRELLDAADTVLAVGTELGPTDFDMYETGWAPGFRQLIRVDVDPEQLDRIPAALTIAGRADAVLPALLDRLATLASSTASDWGAAEATRVTAAAHAELSPTYAHLVALVETIRDALPGAVLVGDSTQLVYAADLWYGHDSDRGWFNSATGYGALGYAIPAAIGAAIGSPDRPVVCITGDGGAQFSLPELMVAVDEQLSIVFLVWNNRGYQEIADAMRAADVPVIGCDPTPPDFASIAAACSMRHVACADDASELAAALTEATGGAGPVLLDIRA